MTTNGVWIKVSGSSRWHYQIYKWKTRCGKDASRDVGDVSGFMPEKLATVCLNCRDMLNRDILTGRDELHE